MHYEALSGTVIGAAMEVHKRLGSWFLEPAHEHALALELTGRQIPFEGQVSITVMYKQAQVGEYRADLLVDGTLLGPWLLSLNALPGRVILAHCSPEFEPQVLDA